MPPRKRKPSAPGKKVNQAARKTVQTQEEQLPSEERSAPQQPDELQPEAPLSGIKGQLQAARNPRSAAEGEPMSLSENDIKKAHRDLWQQVGFYSNHPNHNPAAINEAYTKSMMRKSHKLGKVKAKYRLFINKPTGKRAMLLQYPNRSLNQEYRAAYRNKPLEIRIKPKCGLVEVDIPLNVYGNYDKEKGIEYGEALRKSRLLREGGSFGLGGGLGTGPRPMVKDDRGADSSEGPLLEDLLEEFDDANNKGHVMSKMTLGGQIYPLKNGDPIYMAATFQKDICTWTKLDAIVQLRPQFSHLDALFEARSEAKIRMARVERPDMRENVDPEPEAKAVNMAVKATEVGEEDMYGGMKPTAKLLRDMRDEPWQRLAWVDQDDPESYQVYNDSLIYQDPDIAPHLVSEMTDEQYLDAISCPRIDPIKQGKKVMAEVQESLFDSEDGDEKVEITDDTEQADDLEEVEEEYEILPKGAIPPDDCVAERRIERIARAICIHPVKEQPFYEEQIKQKVTDDAKWAKHSFLLPEDPHHTYYRYRIAENRAGRGIDPEYDTFEIATESPGGTADKS